ncbi:MMPL family transporter [Ornithinimicrobium sp. F0845]|uniref:MMPL family transporter n=1 Tax=Ornithinimicrobium sp. F0845 TaxID=2926412 RepID=UPI001FF294B7|nr:MMPL family transporter [Ornithinimicrobium sp. F0845]MCK0110727.1 MMPL family transporter [Ornithinimicrobium sp. F0845]
MGAVIDRLIDTVTGRRTAWIVALLGLLVGAGVMAGLGEAERDPHPTDTLPVGYESTQGVELQERLPTEDTATAIILFSADSEIGPSVGELEQVVEGLDTGVPGPPAFLQPSEDGTAAISVVNVPARTATEVAASVSDLRTSLRDATPEGVDVQVTGPAAVRADLTEVFAGANTTLLAFTASVVALLLLVTYRSPTLWLVPLTVVAIADRTAAILATQVLALFGVPWDESTIGILSVLVFGAGTNYALLLISRYRDELRTDEDRHRAMARALRRTSEAVLASAATVVVGVLTLLLSVFPNTRGLGLASAVGIIVAAAFVLLMLPAALVLFGRWIFWPKVPRVGEESQAGRRSAWRRIGDQVAVRPRTFIVGTLTLLAAMAFGLTQLQLGLPASEQFTEKPEAIVAAERLAESFPEGAADPTVVVTATEDEATVEQLITDLEALEPVGSVSLGAQGGGVTQLSLVLTTPAESAEARAALDEVRTVTTDVPETYVTGTAAEAADASDASSRDRLVILPIILILVLLALAAILRSVVAPVILVASVIASFCAALGVSWWLFTGLLGFSGLEAIVPLYSFLFLVALGVDYNIFLITRTLEEAGHVGSREGVLRALSATGGVITSAGILLAAVFAVLGVLPLVVLAQVGAVICIGVLLDTLLVRTILVPAIVLTLGERFWWPRRVGPQEPDGPARSDVDRVPASAG